MSQSSIGTPELREDAANPVGVMLGEARAIRSDEYLTSTPLGIGVTATGSAEDVNPLTAPQEMLSVLPSGPITTVLFLDGTALKLGPLLPDQVLMSARGWLGTLLLVLAAPAWFRVLTGSRWIGYFAVALIAFSPHNAWWSNTSVGILGFAFAGAVSLQRAALAAHEGRYLRAVIWGMASAVLLVRTPLLYPPWALVLVPAVVLGMAAGLLARAGARRSALVTIGSVGVLTVLLLGAVLWENWEALEAARGTVYPGARLATGAAHSMQTLFGATNLDILTEVDAVVGGNQSEISSGFTIGLVLAVLLLARGFLARVVGHRWAVVTVLSITGFWMIWSTVDFGALGYRIPLVNMVPAGRAAQVVGHLAVILLCLVLPGTAKRGSVAFSVLAAGVTAIVTGYAGSLLRVQNVPELSVRTIWIAALAVAVVVFLLTYRPRAPWGYVLGGVLAFSLVWNVNPLLFGLADLRESSVAKDMLESGRRARADGVVWASDAYSVDTLMIATGVPALTGRQMAGPDVEEWEKLDPGRAHEDVWNRGGSFIWFTWNEDDRLVFDNPSPDAIRITGSPCVVAERLTELTTIVATRELDLDCLTEVDTFTWGGQPRWTYTVRP
uniref:DUF7657 domain-containing protein n=1 Tax=Nocardioides terrigena TaxID=424797 RepID=UPI00131F1579|nr:hypothetical protein [Nocardioides terrigena]